MYVAGSKLHEKKCNLHGNQKSKDPSLGPSFTHYSFRVCCWSYGNLKSKKSDLKNNQNL